MSACFEIAGIPLVETEPVCKGIQKGPILLGIPLRLDTSAVACIDGLSQFCGARCCRPVRRSLAHMRC